MAEGISPNPLNKISQVYLDRIAKINSDPEIAQKEREKWQTEAKVDTGSAEEKATARNKRNTPAGKDYDFDTKVFITRKPGESLESARTRKRRDAHAAKRGVSEAKVDTGDDVKKETDRNKRRFGKDAAPRGSGGVEYAQTLVRRREHRAKRGVKENFSDWRTDLREIVDEIESEAEKKVDEKKNIKNKVVINPKLGEAVEQMGGQLLEVAEVEDDDAKKDLTAADKDAQKAEALKKKEQMLKKRIVRMKMMAVNTGAGESIVAGYEPDIEGAVEYFYEEGINEDGIDLLIEEIGLEEFVDFVDGGAVDLNEERKARKMNVRTKAKLKKDVEAIKADKSDVVKTGPKDTLARARTERAFKKRKLAKPAPKSKKDYDGDGKKETPKQEHRGVRNKKITKAVAKAKPAQPKKPVSKDGLRAKIKSAYEAGVKRHRKATQPVRVFHKGMKAGAKKAVKFAKDVKKVVSEKLDYDPMDDPDFDPHEAEKKRGVSGKNNPKGGKKLKDLTKEEVVHEKFATQYKDKGKLSKTDAPGSRHDHTHDVDPRMADHVPTKKVRKSSKAETRANVLKFDMKKEETIHELNRYEKETGKSSGPAGSYRGGVNTPRKGTPTKKGGSSDKIIHFAKSLVRGAEGRPTGQTRKSYDARGKEQDRKETPAQTVTKRREAKARADAAMRDTRGT